MKHTILTKTFSLFLAFLLMFNLIAPVALIDAHASYDLDVEAVSSSSVQPKIGIVAVGAIAKIIGLGIKGIGAIKYAIENYDSDSSDSRTNLALSYFSGNAYDKELETTRDAITAEFNLTYESVIQLEAHIKNLQSDVSQLSKDLEKLGNAVKAQELKLRLDDFYTNFFVPAYSGLIEAYNAVGDALSNEKTNEATLRAKLDDLYMKANELKKLDTYITGTAFFDNSGIIDVYYKYTLEANNVKSDGSDEYFTVASRVQDFALNLLAASSLQKLCTAYASSYQLHYYYDHYDEMVENNEFVGYIVSGSSNLSTNKLTEYEIRNNISYSYDNIQTISGEVAKMISKVNMLDSYVGYVENESVYYAPVKSSKLNIYSGATYNLFSISDDLGEAFQEDFTFVSSNNKISVSDTGTFTFDGKVTSSFTISYVYGNETLTNPITVYSITFVPSNRTFSGGYGDVKSPYLISKVSELKDFASNSTYHADGVCVKLTNDINLNGSSVPEISQYYGTFDGDNHKLYGATGTYVLFSTNHGTIKNLIIADCKLSSSSIGGAYQGVVAHGNQGKIVNCHVKNTSVYIYCGNYSKNGGYSNFRSIAGGIVGINNGTIEYCSVTEKSSVKAEISTRELYDNGKIWDNDGNNTTTIEVGGIAGENNGKVNNCYIGSSTVSSHTYAKYYKWTFLWEGTYNRVTANVYYGNIVGKNSGECNSNQYYGITSSSHTVQKIAASKSDDKFVTSNITAGVQGTVTTSSSPETYLKSISVISSPMNTQYLKGTTFNFAGLEIVDNMGNLLYGFKLDGFTSDSDGNRKVKLKYDRLESSINVEIGCDHKHIRIDEGAKPTCITDGVSNGVFCLTCNKYIDGNQPVSKNNKYCYDDSADHKCELCAREISTCEDKDNNHICDYCGKKFSNCSDLNADYRCDICGLSLCICKDSDKNHYCDICKTKMTDCYDENKDHYCEMCKKMISNHTDEDRNHKCDLCLSEVGSHIEGNNKHTCDYCGKKVSDCADVNYDHKCDVCRAEMGNHIEGNNKHTCDYCGKKVNDCVDANRDHKCDVCLAEVGSHIEGNNKHTCDYCGKKVSDCADVNYDHKCDICALEIGKHIEGSNNKHLCDYCGKKASDCVDANYDHKCDICAIEVGRHIEGSNKHTCDYCGKKVSDCADVNYDHKCDTCFVFVSNHTDMNDDKKCDVCNDKMGNDASVWVVVIVTIAVTAGVGGLGVGLWFYFRKPTIIQTRLPEISIPDINDSDSK